MIVYFQNKYNFWDNTIMNQSLELKEQIIQDFIQNDFGHSFKTMR